MHLLVLRALANTLADRVRGAMVRRAGLVDDRQLALDLAGRDAARLILSVRPGAPHARLTTATPRIRRALTEQLGGVAELLAGSTIVTLAPLGWERLLYLRLEAHPEATDRRPRHLFLELLPRTPFLVVAAGEPAAIQAAIRAPGTRRADRRTMERDSRYEAPFGADVDALRAAPLETARRTLLEALAGGRADGEDDEAPAARLATALRGVRVADMAAVLAPGAHAGRQPEPLDARQVREALAEAVLAFRGPLAIDRDADGLPVLGVAPTGEPAAAEESAGAAVAAPGGIAPGRTAPGVATPGGTAPGGTVPPATDDALETLDRWLAAFDAEASLAVLHRELRALARRERRRHAAARRVLDRESSEVGAVETLRRQAESVLAHLDRIPAGTARVRLPDPYGGPDLDIELDPRRRPAAAAEALFQRARRLERRREHLDARRTELEATARRLEHLEGVLESSDATALEETARQLVAEGTLDARVLAGEPARPPAAAPRRPYRVIELGDGWEVWVGRSSADNDELTHRLAAPHDLWLHAFGAAGAHVILRRTDGGRAHPPRRLIERAAAIAAYHSNARHSGAVPVSVTERRYVRRPRNAPPGTAVTLRDETLMVEPWQPTTGR